MNIRMEESSSARYRSLGTWQLDIHSNHVHSNYSIYSRVSPWFTQISRIHKCWSEGHWSNTSQITGSWLFCEYLFYRKYLFHRKYVLHRKYLFHCKYLFHRPYHKYFISKTCCRCELSRIECNKKDLLATKRNENFFFARNKNLHFHFLRVDALPLNECLLSLS